MSKLSAVPVGVLTVAGILGMARQAYPEGIQTLQDELCALPSALELLNREEQRGDDLEWRLRILEGRMAGRRLVAQAYLEGWMTLAQAVERFDALNHSPSYWPFDHPEGDAYTRQEKVYRQVSTWIIKEVQDRDPRRAAHVASQLESEFRQLRKDSGLSQSH
jgi:hypothetical protein